MRFLLFFLLLQILLKNCFNRSRNVHGHCGQSAGKNLTSSTPRKAPLIGTHLTNIDFTSLRGDPTNYFRKDAQNPNFDPFHGCCLLPLLPLPPMQPSCRHCCWCRCPCHVFHCVPTAWPSPPRSRSILLQKLHLDRRGGTG